MLSLDVIAAGGMVVSLLGLVYLLRTTNDQLLHRIAVVKRHDRTLRNWQFALVIVLVVAAEVALCRWLQVPLEFAILFGALTLYLPCTFFFYCNVYHVGSRRELIWSCVFLFACSLSLYLFEDVSLLLVLPVGIATTALLCFGAARDPYCHYRRGLRELDEHHAPEAAREAFETATRLDPQEPRYRFHLARALLAVGEEQAGRELLAAVSADAPGFVEHLRDDPLCRPEWLAVL